MELLLAQAKSEGMLLLTCDALLLGHEDPFSLTRALELCRVLCGNRVTVRWLADREALDMR